MTIKDLLDREEIRLLMARYNVNGDRGRIDQLAETFADDGVLDFNGEHSVGRGAIVARLNGETEARATVMRHHLGQSLVDIEGNHAKGRTYFALLNAFGLDHHGVYADTMVRTPHGWRFALRQVRIDWQSDSSAFPPMATRGRSPAA